MNVLKIWVSFFVFIIIPVYGAAVQKPTENQAAAPQDESPGRKLYRLIAAQKDGDALELLQSGTINEAAVNERMPENPHSPTPLHRALARKKSPPQLVRALLKAQADVHADGNDGLPLMVATATGDQKAVEILVEEGKADPNVVSNLHYGATALHSAALNNSQKIARYLVKQGARRDIKDRSDMTADEWAAAQMSVLTIEDERG